jgi:Gpi18-like mannosyltransferase
MLALNTKPQTIVFAPVLLFVLLYSVRNIKTVVAVIAAAVATQLALLIPFLAAGTAGKILYHASHSVDLYNKLSISAFNIWYLLQPGNPYFINDKDIFILLSYKAWGLALFAASAILVLWPMAKALWQARQANTQPDERTYALLFLGTGMLCLYFFYFNSQMHERYAHPIIIFFFFYSVVSRNYRLYILASIPYFLSLDKAFSFPDGYLPIPHYKVIYASKIIALWYTATVVYGSYLYLKLARSHRQLA